MSRKSFYSSKIIESVVSLMFHILFSRCECSVKFSKLPLCEQFQVLSDCYKNRKLWHVEDQWFDTFRAYAIYATLSRDEQQITIAGKNKKKKRVLWKLRGYVVSYVVCGRRANWKIEAKTITSVPPRPSITYARAAGPICLERVGPGST